MRFLIILLMFLVSCGDIIIPEDKIPDQNKEKIEEKQDVGDNGEIEVPEVGTEVQKEECQSSVAKVVYKDSERTIYACVEQPTVQEKEDHLRKWCRYRAEMSGDYLKLTYLPKGEEDVKVIPVYYLKQTNLDTRIMLVDSSGEEICRILRWDGEYLDVYQLYNRVNISVKIGN